MSDNPNNSNMMQPSVPKRTLTGTVTKLVGDGATYGFINDQIFFQQAKITNGARASVGDTVFAECEYSANLPIKWNATSVKILNKATGNLNQQISLDQQQGQLFQQQANPTVVNNNNQMNIDQNQSSVTPLTYQQHRQLRQNQQQQHTHDPRQQQQQLHKDLDAMLHQPTTRLLPEPMANKQSPVANFNYQQEPAGSGRLLPQTTTSVSSGTQPVDPRQQQQQQQQAALNPSIPPMGPANFAFANQLGAVFLQPGNQPPFMQTPAPFLGQQAAIVPPPHLLAATQQQPPPLLPQNQNNNSNNNSSSNSSQNYQAQQQQPRQGKSNQTNERRFGENNKVSENRQTGGGGGGNRGANSGAGNKNRHNHDNKFNDRPRSRDRDGSQNRHQLSNNNKSGKQDNNQAGGRDSRKRIEGSASPRRGASYSSTSTSGQHSSVEKVSSKTTNHRQQYDVQNIPKTTITENINPQNIKVRCPSSLHVPSDLKEVIVNKFYRFDLRNIPKPVNIVIDKTGKQSTTTSGTAINNEQQQSSAPTTDEQNANANDSINSKSGQSQSTDESTPPSSKTDVKLVHKYGVKIVLLSLPEMDAIYKHVFGPNLDTLSSESTAKTITSDLDNMIQLLCNKGTNNGYSLIGGKFDQNLDGFVDGVTNHFEKSRRQPDLIATCKRVVMDQLSFDLSSCKKWTWLATFIYNNRNDYFSQKASIEYSYIYIPHIWTMKSEDFDKILLQNKEVIQGDEDKDANSEPKQDDVPEAKMDQDESVVEPSAEANESESQAAPKDEPMEVGDTDQVKDATPVQTEPQELQTALESDNVAVSGDTLSTSVDRESLNEMKVTDLKSKLDSLNVKYESRAKKSDLVSLLAQTLETNATNTLPVAQDTSEPAATTTTTSVGAVDDANELEANPESSSNADSNNDLKTEAIDSSKETTLDGKQEQTTNTEGIVQSEDSQLSEGEVAASANASDTEGEIDTDQRETNKRKISGSEANDSSLVGPEKKARKLESVVDGKNTIIPKKDKPAKIELIKEPFVVRPRDPDQQQLSLVSLHETYQPARYDQFELSMASNLLKESLIQHFSEYILTTLVEDFKRGRRKESATSGNGGGPFTGNSSGASTCSQDTINDTNNNNATKSTSSTTNNDSKQQQQQLIVGDLDIQTSTTNILPAKQEYPIPRYINLAFTYFDANHLGYLHLDDLSKLFNNTKLTISRRALLSLMSNSDDKERCQYQFIPDLPSKFGPTYVYKFPRQFSNLPGTTPAPSGWKTDCLGQQMRAASESAGGGNGSPSNVTSGDGLLSGNIVQFKGETYNLEKLIEQVREAEALRVNLVDRFNHAIENFDKQAEEIHVLEVSRKTLANAIKAQNDEISELKKERDGIKKKLDSVRSRVKSTVGSLQDLLKEEK